MSPRGRELLKRQLVWVTVGLLAYLGAGFLLLVALLPAFAESGLDVGALGPEQMGALFASLVLFVLGGYAARRLRNGMSRERSERGMADAYQPGLDQEITHDGGGTEEEDGDSEVLTCPNCGARNERFYTYCGECSEKL